jgi:subtilisin-like proprotein convertase family protein
MGESLKGSVQSTSKGQLEGWQIQIKDGQVGDTGNWRSWRLVVTGH